jgi:UDP-N-acetylglucosamine acyltransferase
MIHPSAVIHPRAQLDPTVTVGPCTVIDEHVVLGPNNVVGPHVYITGHTTIGVGNQFHAGSVIGNTPQDFKYKGEPTRLRIGDHNTFREHVTLHVSNKMEEDTVIGSHCFLMQGSHVGHNSVLGDRVIFGGCVMLGGHVLIQDGAFLSGTCMVHQFCRVGAYAIMQATSAISQDLPPYTIARGINGICGLNIIGLRRNGFTAEQRLELKKLYHLLFRRGLRRVEAVEQARALYQSETARRMIDFVESSKRGVCADTGHRRKTGGEEPEL